MNTVVGYLQEIDGSGFEFTFRSVLVTLRTKATLTLGTDTGSRNLVRFRREVHRSIAKIISYSLNQSNPMTTLSIKNYLTILVGRFCRQNIEEHGRRICWQNSAGAVPVGGIHPGAALGFLRLLWDIRESKAFG